MEFSEKLNAAIHEWREEDKENRAIFVLAIEKQNVTKDGCELATCGWLNGSYETVRNTIYSIMSEKNPQDPVLHKLFHSAMRRYALDGMIKSMGKSCQRIGRIMEQMAIMTDDDEEETSDSPTNDAETAGKEDSHE